jgi:hypothetical protein
MSHDEFVAELAGSGAAKEEAHPVAT